MPKLALHWWILIAMVAGVLFGFLGVELGFAESALAVLKPAGTIFLNLLKMIAVPLVFFSLVAGVASLNDMSKLGRIGGKTIGLYLGTTAIAITVGLVVVNVVGPGKGLTEETRTALMESGKKDKSFAKVQAQDKSLQDAPGAVVLEQLAGSLDQAKERLGSVSTSSNLKQEDLEQMASQFREGAQLAREQAKKERDDRLAQGIEDEDGGVSVIDELVGIVPTNPFASLATAKMLQVVFFSLLLGVALTRLFQREPKVQSVIDLFQLMSDAIIEMVTLIMKIAPLGVFALMGGLVLELGGSGNVSEIFGALGWYMFSVVLALFLHGLIVYGTLLTVFTKVSPFKFLKALAPAQLLAFSSSSSGATLPVTIRCVEDNLGVDEEASSFVLPLGATINMDGTGLYQGVAAVFIANVVGVDLTIGDQLTIVLTAALASIGTAAVPGVGIVLLTIVLKQVGLPLEAIALILGVDRPLDMCRTVLNVTGDATVTTVVASSEGLIHEGTRHVGPS